MTAEHEYQVCDMKIDILVVLSAALIKGSPKQTA